MLLHEIITGERPKRGNLRLPTDDECPQVRAGRGSAGATGWPPACLMRPPTDPRRMTEAFCHSPFAHALTCGCSSPALPGLQSVRELMLRCLSVEPAARPTAAEIVPQLRAMKQASKHGPAAAAK